MNKIIDLTFHIHEGVTTFPVPWHPVVEITTMGRHFIEGRETRKVTLGTHTGTHIDAPLHFVPDGKSVDQLPLKILMGKAVLLDFSEKKRGETIELKEVKKEFEGLGEVKRVVIRTDWSENWMKRGYYEEYPFLSQDVCEWMIEKGIRLVAMDTPSPDDPKNGAQSNIDSPNHKMLLTNEVIIIEYLTNLNQIGQRTFTLIALPLKLLGCDGAPARVVARV